jgi:hypothetical protein
LKGVDFQKVRFGSYRELAIHYIVIELDGSNPAKEQNITSLLEINGYNYIQPIGLGRNGLFEKMNWTF